MITSGDYDRLEVADVKARNAIFGFNELPARIGQKIGQKWYKREDIGIFIKALFANEDRPNFLNMLRWRTCDSGF